jgi:biotin carboxyl carrier protein
MSRALWRVLLLLLVLGGAALLIVRFRAARQDVTRESAREEPVVAPSRVAEAAGAVAVSLDTAAMRRVALTLTALAPAAGRSELALPAEVSVETERTVELRAPVAGRFTVPDGVRWPSLGERVRAGVELARVSDARPIAPAISGTVTKVSAQPGSLVEAGQVLLEIADLSRPVVRVVWLEAAGDTPAAHLTLRSGTGLRIPARLVGPAPEADPVTRRPAYLYRAARSWPGAAPGVPVVALVRSSHDATPADSALARGTVVVPDSAVVQWEGLTWIYRRRAPGMFERVRVATDRPVPGGWLAGTPLAVGDSVVLHGAEELLSEEFRARVTVGDESGEGE